MNGGKRNIAMYAAAILLCLTLFSSYLMGGLYARYTTEATGSDGARVAKWHVELIGANKETNLNFNGSDYNGTAETLSYTFQVSSESEVAMTYSICITFGKVLPEHLFLRLDNGEWQDCNGQTEFVFSGPYSYGATEAEKTHTLEFKVEYATGSGVDEAYSISELQDIPVTIDVTAVQAD